ncbi:MAG: 50S ribosomal protein L11 methyltransferase [Acidobacteria bacterium]|nr:50S ribosomal protein L11 methyltransferase [Acidobacteriota bacterium]
MGEWLLITLRCLPAGKEDVWAILYKFHCIGLEETDSGSILAYFPVDTDRKQVLASLRTCPLILSAEESTVAGQEWHTRWMESYQSFRVNPFFIRPSWRQDHPPPDAVEIVMDPKAAFGSGTHATTQLCLSHLPALVAGKRCMIDVGCGSGILSIAASKIAPRIKLVALDHDPGATFVCRENATINNVSFHIVCGTLACMRERADLIVANLQLDELVRLEADFQARTLPAAALLLSGILKEQIVDLRQTYDPRFDLQDLYFRDDWVAMVYRRR